MSKESQLGNLNISQNVFLPCLPFCPLRLWVTPSISNPKPTAIPLRMLMKLMPKSTTYEHN